MKNKFIYFLSVGFVAITAISVFNGCNNNTKKKI